MTVLQGEGVSGGVASGRLRFFRRNAQETPYRDAAGPEVELARYEAARDAAAAQLDKLYEDMKAALGEKKGVPLSGPSDDAGRPGFPGLHYKRDPGRRRQRGRSD